MIQTEVQSVIPVQLVPVPGLPVPVPKGLRLYHVLGWVAAPVPVPPAHIRQSFDSLLGEEPALPLPQRPIEGKINVCDGSSLDWNPVAAKSFCSTGGKKYIIIMSSL